MDEEEGMEIVLETLKRMGAKNVSFVERDGWDDEIRFAFGGKAIVLRGRHYNDSTGGIGAIITDT